MKGGDLNESAILSVAAMCRILGYKPHLPLTPMEMAKSLRVAFYPANSSSQKLAEFLNQLRVALVGSGVEVISYEKALSEGSGGRVGKGIVLFAPGEGEEGNLAIDHVAGLSTNTVVGVLDGTLPGMEENRLQKRINALVSALVWHMVHVVIYIDDTSWTICNMNGAIDTFSLESLEDRTLHSLIPKLAAPVVPPQQGDFEVHDNAFDASAPDYRTNVQDILAGSVVWGKTGLLPSQTKMEELAFRNSRYRRIAAAYLSGRTGMSYGFLARQLPMRVKPALDLDKTAPVLRRLDWTEKDFLEIDGHLLVALKLGDRRFLVKIPEVSVLCTRSGCEKAKLDPTKDIVKLTLSRGSVILGKPTGVGEENECQPSFDTISILAHAVGNAIVASILVKVRPSSRFVFALGYRGLALAHWHGYIDATSLPVGYHLHGEANPPVSCSTPQAAIFALSGKLACLHRSFAEGREYLGDVHVEPSHGTNITGGSLTDLAQSVVRTMGELVP